MIEKKKRICWFQEARFGMFIHWGLYSIPARYGDACVSYVEKTNREDYQVYFDEFNPVRYDPSVWARAAKAAGLKYAILTAKHGEGFCLFDSKLTDYKATNTLAKRDLAKEFTDAFRAEGLKVGFYYTLADYHHEDYPVYGNTYHPMRDNEAYKGMKHDLEKYVDYYQGQVRELLTNYGKIDIIWFDFLEHDNLTKEIMKVDELVKMVFSLQPDIIMNDRLSRNIRSKETGIFKTGDFYSPEQIIPPDEVVDEDGNPIPWESCITMNNSWGYNAADKDYKSAKLIIRGLVECVGKNGNMLMNIGPNAKGEIPEQSLSIMAETGKWMVKNGESIYGCSKADLPKPEWGRYTQKGNSLYAHIYERGIGNMVSGKGTGTVIIRGLRGKVKKIRLLSDGSEIKLDGSWYIDEYPDDILIDFSSSVLPDEIDTVLELELI